MTAWLYLHHVVHICHILEMEEPTMYTFPCDKPAPGARLRLTPDMIERRLNVQPFDITIDIPIMFTRSPMKGRRSSCKSAPLMRR